MKKTVTYYDGTQWTTKKSSEAAFSFIIDENTLTIKAPEVEPGLLDKAAFDAESLNALRGYMAWSDDRRALTRKNDGTGIKVAFKEADKDFVATAPESCQLAKHCQMDGADKLSKWLEAQSARYGFTEEDDEEESEEEAKAEAAEEPAKTDDSPKEESEEKAEKAEEKPDPAPAKVSKLSPDPKDWTDKDIDDLFNGEAEI